MLGFGTYRLNIDITLDMVQMAYDKGIRHFDTAQLYKNDRIVTDWLQTKGDVFLTTKIHRNLIKNSYRDNRAIIDSIYGHPDLVLLHSPENNYEIAWLQLIHSGVDCKFGVSNFTPEHMEVLATVPYANQIELSIFCQAKRTVHYCENKGIRVQGHSSIAKGELLDEGSLCTFAKKYDATVAQVMLAWGLKKNYTMCFTTKDTDHLDEDVNSVHLVDRITDDDMKMLDTYDCGYRTHPQFMVV